MTDMAARGREGRRGANMGLGEAIVADPPFMGADPGFSFDPSLDLDLIGADPLLDGILSDPATAKLMSYGERLLALFDRAPELAALLPLERAEALADRESRRAQKRGKANRKPRVPTGRPRGRPRLTEEEAAASKDRRRALTAARMRRKRARDAENM